MPSLEQIALQAKYDIIVKLLIENNFSKRIVAEILGVDRKTIYNILAEARSRDDIKLYSKETTSESV